MRQIWAQPGVLKNHQPTQGLLRSLGPEGSAEWGYPAVGRCHLATWWVLFCSAVVLSSHPWTSAQEGPDSLQVPRKNLAHGLILFLGAMACSMWDLSSLTRDRAHASCSGKCSLHHWTLREVPGSWIWWYLLDRALVLDVLSHQR